MKVGRVRKCEREGAKVKRCEGRCRSGRRPGHRLGSRSWPGWGICRYLKEREKWRMLFFQMGSCNSEKVEGFVNVNVNVNVSVKS